MLMHHLYNADVLVTPHGFQSMLLLFLPRPAIIFEVFPYRYYKRGYGPFGGEYGEVFASASAGANTNIAERISFRPVHFFPCERRDADSCTGDTLTLMVPIALTSIGVIHGGVMSPPTTWQTKLVLPYISTATCMDSKMCREFSRNQDVL
jgi:hypothetical protein